MPKSALWMLNFFVLQWFFVRLARCYDGLGKPRAWKILKWIRPLSGWTNDFVYVRWRYW